MGSQASTTSSLQILKVAESSVSHKRNILPFVHTIVGFNSRSIENKDDVLVLSKEWENGPLRLELMDMRTMETFTVEIPRKRDVRLGISVKFHPHVVPLLSMEVLKVNTDSPAERSGLVTGDHILGVENLSSSNEDDLLRFIDENREHLIPLLVYNHKLGYVRVVDLQVGVDVLLGCQIGMGELYRVPYRPKGGRVEFDVSVIDCDIKRLKEREEEFLEGHGGEDAPGAVYEPVEESAMSSWTHEQTPVYNPPMGRGVPAKMPDPTELNVPLDLDDVSEIPGPLPTSYEVPGSVKNTEGINLSVCEDCGEEPVTSMRGIEVSSPGQMERLKEILEKDAEDDNFDIENNLSLVSKPAETEDVSSSIREMISGLDTGHVHRDDKNRGVPEECDLSLSGVDIPQPSHEATDGCSLCFEHHRDSEEEHLSRSSTGGGRDESTSTDEDVEHFYEEMGLSSERANGRHSAGKGSGGKRCRSVRIDSLGCEGKRRESENTNDLGDRGGVKEVYPYSEGEEVVKTTDLEPSSHSDPGVRGVQN